MRKRARSTIQAFVTGGPAMNVYYIAACPDTGKLVTRKLPVIGWVHTRQERPNPEVEGGFEADEQIRPGVFSSEFGTVDIAEDMISGICNAQLVGTYPDGVEPPQADFDLAVELLREDLREQYMQVKNAQEPYRTRRQESILCMAAALPVDENRMCAA